MKMQRLMAALAWLVLSAAEVWAADLAQVKRVILREPAYRSKPKYCLLVFGPQAKTRVWLVQDGNTLYVDRNGNGDLTEGGEQVAAQKRDGAEEGEYSFQAGHIRDGTRWHKHLSVSVSKLDHLADMDKNVKALLAKDPKARGYRVSVAVEMPGWKGADVGGRVQQHASYMDVNGVLQFAGKPQDAPVIHFGGPWQVTLFGQHELVIGRETDVVLGVGTPGVGPGTTSYIDYEGVIPEKVYPTLEITYPARQKGKAPVRERYELKRRC